MNKYLLVFYGGKMETDPKMAEKTLAKWNQWYAVMGKAVVDGGAPTAPGKIISESGVKSVGARPVTGYTVLQAENMDAVITMAKGCPIIPDGGQVAVYPMLAMM
jgi:hypothetical protein